MALNIPINGQNEDICNILITKLQVNLDFQRNITEICRYNTPMNGKLFYLCGVIQKWVTDILDESVLAFYPLLGISQIHISTRISKYIHHLRCHILLQSI